MYFPVGEKGSYILYENLIDLIFFLPIWRFLVLLKVWQFGFRTLHICVVELGRSSLSVFRWMAGFMMVTCSAHHVGTSVSSVLQKQILQLLTWPELYHWVSSLCGWSKDKDFSYIMLEIPFQETLRQVEHLLF